MNRLIKKYINIVQVVGDMESYSYLGEAVGYRVARNKLASITKKVKRIVVPMSSKERIEFGGYGKVPERFEEYNDYISKIYL